MINTLLLARSRSLLVMAALAGLGMTYVMAIPALSQEACGFEEDVETPDPGWKYDFSANAGPAGGGVTWGQTPDQAAHSPSNSFFSDDLDVSKDDRLVSPPQVLSSLSHLIFWHRFSTEDGFDGGVLEISTNAGDTWVDLGNSFLEEEGGGYNGAIDPASDNVLVGRPAWTGTSPGGAAMSIVEADLGVYSGSGRLIRWRLGSDSILGAEGWWVDDVAICNVAAVSTPPSESPKPSPSPKPSASPPTKGSATNLIPTAATPRRSPSPKASPSAFITPSPSPTSESELFAAGAGEGPSGGTPADKGFNFAPGTLPGIGIFLLAAALVAFVSWRRSTYAQP